MKGYIKYILNAAFLVMIIYLIYDTYAGKCGLKSYLTSRKEKIKITAEYNYVLSEKKNLEKEIEALKTDQLFLDEQIKINLQKGSKGEIYYLFSEDEQKKSK